MRLREAAWGDMSGFACLVVQPLDCCILDYSRSYLSCSRVPAKRCVSNILNLYDQVMDCGGVVSVLVGEAPPRVLGFGSLTPGPAPGQNHAAVLDVAAHENYTDRIPDLIEHLQDEAKGLGLESLLAFVAKPDREKRDLLPAMGYRAAGQVEGALRLNGENIIVAILRREALLELAALLTLSATGETLTCCPSTRRAPTSLPGSRPFSAINHTTSDSCAQQEPNTTIA